MLPRLGLRFALTFAAVAAALFSLYAFPFELFGARSDWLSGYLAAYARLAGGVLQLFDANVTVLGSLISGRFSLQIVRNCDAVEINILFASAVLAFPAPLTRRLRALGPGLVLLVAVNVLRICALYFIGAYAPGWFRTAHEEILPLLLVAVTALLFLFAARNLVPPEPARATGQAA